MQIQVALSAEDFAEDLNERLGRANGNIYQRKPALARVHDGQVMVRLKKKRFIILDYTITPNELDYHYSTSRPEIELPEGAGRTNCTNADCTKVGIPVKLFDSHPTEPVSLYLRSGLCFECQRNLNEKRRVDRKRTNKETDASILYALGPSNKKFKINGNTVHLRSDAVILNGSPGDETKTYQDGYSQNDIGIDLRHFVREATHDVAGLLQAAYSNSTGGVVDDGTTNGPSFGNPTTPGAVANVATAEDVTNAYDRAFSSLHKSVFLLAQWKTAWDAASDHSSLVADAVVSAAAAVAAAAVADGADPNGNMASLLLAADKDKQREEDSLHHHNHEDPLPSPQSHAQQHDPHHAEDDFSPSQPHLHHHSTHHHSQHHDPYHHHHHHPHHHPQAHHHHLPPPPPPPPPPPQGAIYHEEHPSDLLAVAAVADGVVVDDPQPPHSEDDSASSTPHNHQSQESAHPHLQQALPHPHDQQPDGGDSEIAV